MKHYRMMILAVLLTMVGRALADNLTVETVKMSAGETKQVAIALNNPTHKYAAFQFDLVLPEGISIAKNEKGKYIASLNEDRMDDHTLNVSETGTNTFRFLAFSMTNTEFYGTDGALVYVTLQASESISEGNKTVTIQSQVFTEVSGEQYKWDNTIFTVEIGGGGGSGDPNPPVVGDDMLSVEAVNMSAGEMKQIAIVLNNPTHKYAAFQFDLVLPEGISIAKNNKGKFDASLNEDRKDDHTLNVSETEANTYRFLAFSMTNTEFSGTDGSLVYVTLLASESISEGSKTATIQSQVFTEVSGEQYKWSEKTFQITIEAVVPITITAKNYTREYGEDNPTFEYTVTGGSITSGTPTITCSATKESLVGTYDIVIEKGTVSNKSVELVKGTLTIKKATLKVTAKDYTIKQGEALPTFEATYEGFKNSETKDVLIKQPTITTTATSASEPNTYDIVVSDAEAQNYEISYVKGKLTITEADPVTVTAKSYSREYGEENPTFEFTSEGATLTGTPEITCEATATSPVGTYSIVIKKGTVTNYNDKYVNGTLTITKAPLKITGKNYTIKQGEALPTFEATYEGFKNSETKDVLIKQPTITTTATSASEPNTYDIVVSDAEAQNYEISYVKGKLTITEADPVTVTAKSYSREYGEENPTFEFTSEGATLTGTPEITCEATATSPVGTYSIMIKKGTVTNYNDTYVNGTLTITKAPLTVQVENVTREQYVENPEFVITYTGWKLDEDESVLTKKPIVTTSATKDSPVGEYDIVVSGGEAKNYDLKYQNGVLTIIESTGIATISVTNPVDVYNVQGRMVRSKATTLEGLPNGVYIINGKKVVLK